MQRPLLFITWVASQAALTCHAFTPPTTSITATSTTKQLVELESSTVTDANEENSSNNNNSNNNQRPPPLNALDQVDDWAGNAHFDPLRLAGGMPQLILHRQYEIKHARLAMLGCAGLPLSHLFEQEFDVISGTQWLENSQTVLDRVAPVFWGSCVGFMAVLELSTLLRPNVESLTVVLVPPPPPGLEYQFDPLSLYPTTATEQRRMQALEIVHGRAAMVGMAVYLLQEYNVVTGQAPLVKVLWENLKQW